MADDDDFGGFEEAQPSININNDLNLSSLSLNEKQKTPDWLLETVTKTTKILPSLPSPPLLQSNNNSQPNKIDYLEEQLKRALNLIQNQQENYQNLYKQFELLRLTNVQLNKELELNLKNINLNQIKLLNEENEKLFEQKLLNLESKLEKFIQKSNLQLEEKFERKLALTQEQFIKHLESENEVLEIRLNKKFKQQIDDELNNSKFKSNIDLAFKEQKTDIDKLINKQYLQLNDNFKEQIKSNIEQETLIIKDLVNKKLESLIKNYETKSKRSNFLYSRQLTNLSSFLDTAKTQIDLMQNHIKKQSEKTQQKNLNNNQIGGSDEDEAEIDDEILLSM